MNRSSIDTGAVHARGVLVESEPEHIVLGIPETEYRLHLRLSGKAAIALGKRITGTIKAKARRIDVVGRGGRYIEPVYGRPRRVQGEILVVDPYKRAVTVDAGVPIECELDQHQQPSDFKVGDFVSFDVHSGASFAPAPERNQEPPEASAR